MPINIILCGVGGQGTVLASKLLSAAAMARGLPVMGAETIGMAQRGGSVFSHIRIGKGACAPMIALGQADLIIGFEPGEAVRMLPYLKPQGSMIVSSSPVMPVTAALAGGDYSAEDMLTFLRSRVSRLCIVDSEASAKVLGSSRVLNLVLLGVAAQSGAVGLSAAELEAAMLQKVRPVFHDINRRALAYGASLWTGSHDPGAPHAQ